MAVVAVLDIARLRNPAVVCVGTDTARAKRFLKKQIFEIIFEAIIFLLMNFIENVEVNGNKVCKTNAL